MSTATAPATSVAPGRTERIAAVLASAPTWTRTVRDGRPVYAIPSASRPSVAYLVDLSTCTCPDFENRGGPCKHMLGLIGWLARQYDALYGEEAA